MLNTLFDFFVNITINLTNLFNFLFKESFNFTINGTTYTILPIGLLIGGVALSVGFLRRIL